jgi:hypothetical protein
MQKKLLSLGRKLEILEIKEKNSNDDLGKLKKELEKAKLERDTLQNLVNSKSKIVSTKINQAFLFCLVQS